MNLKPGDFYDCYAEHAEFHEGKKGGLFLKMTYRFPQTGDKLYFYHTLIKADGTVRTVPADWKNPNSPRISEQAILEARYGVDLSNFEFDQNALKPDIILRALIEEQTSEFNGQVRTEIRIKSIYPSKRGEAGGGKPPPDKNDLMRRFGSALRAGHAAASRPAPAVAKPNAHAPTPPKTASAKKPTAPASSAVPAATSTMDECWTAFCNANKNVDEGTLGNMWFDLLQKELGHQKQESATPQEWGKIKAAIASIGAQEDIPF